LRSPAHVVIDQDSCYEAEMDEASLTQQIALLEERIEELAGTIERCRKAILAAKLSIAIGAVAMAVMIFGPVTFNLTIMLAAMTAVIGGIVVFGSNTSTARQATADMRAAEADRTRMIGMIELRLVGETLH
jgi:hypothetical protein